MSYLGFIHPAISSISEVSNPQVLEIGIENGHSALPILHNLEKLFKEDFLYIGVDIKINPQVTNAVNQMMGIELLHNRNCNALFKEMNSLSFLQQAMSEKLKFDIVFLDGDHNYFTVLSELSMIKALCHKSTLIICDDYLGRYSEEDMFYSERENYKDVRVNEKNIPIKDDSGKLQILHDKATPPVKTEKQGVKSAVDDFLTKNPEWTGFNFVVPGTDDASWVSQEPIILYQKEHIEFEMSAKKGNINFMSIESKKRLHE